MRSPTNALLWEIWRQHRWTVAAIAGVTVAGRLLALLEGGPPGDSPLVTLLAMLAFVLLLGVFNYTESDRHQALGQFPRRLVRFPVTSLRLVTVPVLAGIASIELLFLLWLDPLGGTGSVSVPFVAVLLAALVVFYLWALWAFERGGSLRLIILGISVTGLFFISLLPSLSPTPPPLWRSERVVGGLVAGLAVVAFLMSWRHVTHVRAGGGRNARWATLIGGWIAAARPTRRRTFASPMAAQFWYEWRTSGMVLPAVVAGELVFLILPISWRVTSPAETFWLLLMALATPIALAVPVGMAFCKPTFWSEELAVPAFVGVRPLSAEELVATKMKVAALSAVLAWAVLLGFLAAWLSSWANLEFVSRFAITLWAFHDQSAVAVYGIAVLIVIAGVFLTWRCLVTRLWSGLSGTRRLFVGSVVSLVVLAAAGFLLATDGWPGWIFEDPARLAPVAWIAAAAVIAKYWLAAYAWRGATRRYLLGYLVVWLAGTMAFLALGFVVWNMARIYLATDADRLRSIVILLALLAMPLARIGLAPSSLSRNRHRHREP
jgi:hypothetical protein